MNFCIKPWVIKLAIAQVRCTTTKREQILNKKFKKSFSTRYSIAKAYVLSGDKVNILILAAH